MAFRNKDKELYRKQYPAVNKWLNQCIICDTTGYKPTLPEKITPGVMAEHIREYYNMLEVNDINICVDCEKHLKKNNVSPTTHSSVTTQ